MTLYQDALHPGAARVSWLKSAYLVLFAMFGYGVVFAPSMQVVRRQIVEPKAELIRPYSLDTRDISPLQVQRVLEVRKPEWLNGFAVQFGSNVVLLPSHPQDVTFYERVSLQSRQERDIFSGRDLGWPTEPFEGIES